MMSSALHSQHEALLRAARSGDEHARNLLCNHVREHLWPILCSQMSGWSREDKEDILQATLLAFCERLKDISDAPLSYAYVIMRNKIGNALQRAQERTEAPSDHHAYLRTGRRIQPQDIPSEDDLNPEAYAIHAEQISRVISTLKKLQSFCLTVFVGLLSGRALKDIWNDLHRASPTLKRGTFDKRVFACRRALRKLMGTDL